MTPPPRDFPRRLSAGSDPCPRGRVCDSLLPVVFHCVGVNIGTSATSSGLALSVLNGRL